MVNSYGVVPRQFLDFVKKLEPIKVVLKYEEGRYYGLTDDGTFGCDWSTTTITIFHSNVTNIVRPPRISDALRDSSLLCGRVGGEQFDPLSLDCPILIDWVKWLNGINVHTNSRLHIPRHAPFTEEDPIRLAVRRVQAGLPPYIE